MPRLTPSQIRQDCDIDPRQTYTEQEADEALGDLYAMTSQIEANEIEDDEIALQRFEDEGGCQ